MNKKGSMELSVNSIVILVIAIVLMGLILAFVKSQFDSLDKKFFQNEPEAPVATASNPITLSRPDLIVNADEELGLKAQVYNTNMATTLIAVYPTFNCGGGLTLTAPAGGYIPKDIAPGAIAKYNLVVKVAGASSGTYVCEFGVAGTSPSISKEVTVKVK